MGLVPENQVRTGLPAGGSRIRTAGPPRDRVDNSSAMPEKAKKGSLDSAAPQPSLCLHPLNADICFAISTSDPSLTPLDAGYGPAIFDPDADREIISVDIERDFDILPVQVRSRWIVKPRDFATRHNQAAHRLAIAAPALEPIAEMGRADLVLVGAVDPIIS